MEPGERESGRERIIEGGIEKDKGTKKQIETDIETESGR